MTLIEKIDALEKQHTDSNFGLDFTKEQVAALIAVAKAAHGMTVTCVPCCPTCAPTKNALHALDAALPGD